MSKQTGLLRKPRVLISLALFALAGAIAVEYSASGPYRRLFVDELFVTRDTQSLEITRSPAGLVLARASLAADLWGRSIGFGPVIIQQQMYTIKISWSQEPERSGNDVLKEQLAVRFARFVNDQLQETDLDLRVSGKDILDGNSARIRWRGLGLLIIECALYAMSVVLLAAVGLQAARERRSARRRKTGQCSACGYQLVSDTGICPECGTAVAKN